MNTDRVGLRLTDYALLVGVCAVLFAFPIVHNRTLTIHETVHCQNVREMRADGDWIIPHYGERPWLERPPLPFWLTIPVVELIGDHAAAYRLVSALVACAAVLLVGWMASVWYGRRVGFVSGIVLATLRQFNHYATGPEADIFVSGIVLAAMALVVYLEFRRRPDGAERWWIGRRPWAVMLLFVLLGLGNLTKGLFFADAFVLLPLAAFLLWGERPLAVIRRYVWLPGWLVFLAVGSAWATAAYLRYPDVVDLWFSDYGGRMNTGYMHEPPWYYLLQLPLILLPWTPLSLGGLWLTRREALSSGRTPERFLWCWAMVPLLVFSLPSGKHHHYLLSSVAPWAILGAVACERIWCRLRERSWLRSVRAHPRMAAAAGLALLALFCWGMHVQPRFLNDRYAADRALIRDVRDRYGRSSLLVLDDGGPLDASWELFYLEGRAKLLHNASFLLDERLPDENYVVTRRRCARELAVLGHCDLLFESAHSRDEGSPDARLGLYRVRLGSVTRLRGDVYISPMQATGRAPGPVLQPVQPAGSRTTRK